MMNYIWCGIIFFSVLISFFNGNSVDISSALLQSVEEAVAFTIKLMGMFCLWGGITKVAEKCGITEFFSKLLSPVLKILFPEAKENKELRNNISMSITADMLGIGNAATPLGIKAMKSFKKSPLQPDTATNGMVTFVVMNTAAMRIIPTTVAEIRSNYGAPSPFDILPVTAVTSFCALLVGIILSKVLGGKYE